MRRVLLLAFCTLYAGWGSPATAQITILNSFNPPSAGSLCGIGLDSETSNIWTYPCTAGTILSLSQDGEELGSVPRPGESANDVDVTFTREQIDLGGTTLPAGTLLFINGESGPAEIYAVNKEDGTVIDTLSTGFGNSHVVGGAYHPDRGTFFLVQDNVAGTANGNRIAEVDPVSGDTLQTFSVSDSFSVSYGDVDVSSVTGNLFVVSSIRDAIAEFTPDGAFVQLHELPVGVTVLSGIALDCGVEEAWVSSTGGVVTHLGRVRCGIPTSVGSEEPTRFRVSAAYPNPFRTHFTFSVEGDRPQHVRVAVYDLVGREVESIYDGTMGPGEQIFSLNPTWPSGMYLIRVVGGGVTASQQVVKIN